MDAISLYSASVGSARRMALAPRLRASIASVSLSPITYESARLYPPRSILAKQCSAGLACRCVLLGKSAVDDNIIKLHPLGGKSAEHLVVGWPESLLRERGCAEAVLVCNHYELVREVSRDKVHCTQCTGYKFQFFKGIDLIIHRRLYYESPVSVYKKAHAAVCSRCSLYLMSG